AVTPAATEAVRTTIPVARTSQSITALSNLVSVRRSKILDISNSPVAWSQCAAEIGRQWGRPGPKPGRFGGFSVAGSGALPYCWRSDQTGGCDGRKSGYRCKRRWLEGAASTAG